MLRFFQNLDRRWIFLVMALAVILPVLAQKTYPEYPTPLVQVVFDYVEELPEGSRILLAFDYDPASAGELQPMATAFVRHCIEKKHKMYFIALWPVGPQMIDDAINNEIKVHAPDMVYGEDYVNLGYKSGNEGVIKVIVTDLKQLYTTDHLGTSINDIPMCKNIKSVQDMDLILNVSAGYPGTKEWIQYAVTPYPDRIRMAAGCTGVQAPLLYPYIPNQLFGLLGAIKGAAEYEAALVKQYPRWKDPKYNEALRRMAPQLWGHILILALIVVGNIIFFAEKRREGRR
ncbi:MAG: hypothetical protein IID39_03375 [Planctomycetes bacterium]|nr:hypothetical protein [Planctomycetota bacterium]